MCTLHLSSFVLVLCIGTSFARPQVTPIVNPDSRVLGAQIKGPLYESNNHQLDGKLSATHQFVPHGPTGVGGGLEYTHIPSGSGLDVGVNSYNKGLGTDLNVGGKYNLLRSNDGNQRLDAVGTYSHNMGGAFHRPDNYYGGLSYSWRF